MMRWMMGTSVALLFLVTHEVRAQSPSIADLQRQISELRSEVVSLKREVALLKQQSSLAPPRRPANLAARARAIDSLTDFHERQTAHASLACAAADQGDAKLATETLGKLSDFNMRSQTTYRVALGLAAQGQEDEALKLANSIGDFALRQKLLAKMAKGETTP